MRALKGQGCHRQRQPSLRGVVEQLPHVFDDEVWLCGDSRASSRGLAPGGRTIRAELDSGTLNQRRVSSDGDPDGKKRRPERALGASASTACCAWARGRQGSRRTNHNYRRHEPRRTQDSQPEHLVRTRPSPRLGQWQRLDRSSRLGERSMGTAMKPRTTTATLLTTAAGCRPPRILVGSAPLTSEFSPAAIRWRCEEHRSSHSPIAGIMQLADREEGSRC